MSEYQHYEFVADNRPHATHQLTGMRLPVHTVGRSPPPASSTTTAGATSAAAGGRYDDPHLYLANWELGESCCALRQLLDLRCAVTEEG